MQPKVFETEATATIKQVMDRPSVKAVVADFDVNCNWAMLALAIQCLERKDVIYIQGITDDWFQVQVQTKILGTY